MDFDEQANVAGSVGSALGDPEVRAVMSAFGDGVLTRYGLDIREHKSYMSAATMRSVRTFIKDFGAEDAVTIVKNFFGPPYGGYWKGQPLGTGIFTKRNRHVAMRMLVE